jgi:hypothetical protein
MIVGCRPNNTKKSVLDVSTIGDGGVYVCGGGGGTCEGATAGGAGAGCACIAWNVGAS